MLVNSVDEGRLFVRYVCVSVIVEEMEMRMH